ncbi:MAG: hypothetical protein AAF688_11200 [Bacteroidota bacterium]
MTDDQLKDIVNQLENRNEKDKAFFGFYQYSGTPEESCIKANRHGLELFAVELINAGLKSETLKFEERDIETVSLNTDWADEDADFFFDFIEVTNKDKVSSENTFPNTQETWKDKVIIVGLLAFGLVLIALMLVGLGTVLTWLF